MLKLTIKRESWPIEGSFTISRGRKTAADVVVVELEQGEAKGRGECVPYARYNETVEGVVAALEAARGAIEAGAGRDAISAILSPFAARNALDCALWDLEAKRTGKPVWQLAGLRQPHPTVTAYTLSLAEPRAMAEAAEAASGRPILKLKLGAEGDALRLNLVRRAAPKSRLIVDANEGWRAEQLPEMLKACADVGVEMVEQPLPAANDDALLGFESPVRICADESAHGLESLDKLQGKYGAINIKLDKTGGLTPALTLAREAQARGFRIMVGCMLATSLAMAPAMLLAQFASVVDLDGPLLLARDRKPGIDYAGSVMYPPVPELWG
jgi:L-alanine-DL-glutamate epimerase-like enolase superfamily enzyme